ncbi:RNA polymerase sigma factor, sigma-70 family [Clostridium cavendishii DSM 21758]|uniref:RNA polymerase sigma factor, sigma-70 family n=1 Tax=Clostridium cavendishii DSM 21758 TaxID=1121302 RepID=A0A1M6NBQ9_9CLOT|nr:sigma-70 family RNA polymerase sigma factor [Clostridium cavendishii]SHJ93119.1 RNA polymerase sigma factor, sigma-70 family [Clostridium cavendishii DSM 21758]
MNESLCELIERAKDDDKDALYTIIERFYPSIRKFSSKLNYDEAETDLVIFFILLLQKINLSNFKTRNEGIIVNYLYSSLRNKYIDIYRKLKKNRYTTTELITDVLTDKANSAFDESILMKMVLENLSEKERVVIIEIYYMNNKYKDIESKLNLSRQSINNIRNKALKKIRNSLEMNWE